MALHIAKADTDQTAAVDGSLAAIQKIYDKRRQTLWDRPWVRSLVAFLVICLLTASGAALRGGVQRWAPVGVYLSGALVTLLTSVLGEIDKPLLGGLLLGAVAVAAIGGALSPGVFRELERIEPFRSLAPLALSVPALRRRLYAAYVRRLRSDLEMASGSANREVYAPIPIRTLDARRSNVDPERPPAASLGALLTARAEEARAHVLIESAGGRGKSALVRETVRQALDAFAQDPNRSLPVLCEGEGDTLFDRAKRSLGTEGFSEDLLRALTRAGEFFFVVDGLTESTVTPEMLGKHKEAYDTKCPLLLSSRPNEAFRRAVEATSVWAVVEPQRLDEDTLVKFVQAYGAAPNALTDAMKQACRDAAGTYLPILVRLSLLIAGESPQTVSDIYRGAVRQLLKGDDALRDRAVQLCLDTYWKDGLRRLVYANAPQERKQLLKALLSAGLIVPGDASALAAEEPRTVRFFHDSIQSYLTAEGLARREDWRDVLIPAAGEERFVRDRADLISGGASELFQMLVLVFEPQDELRTTLHERLCDYADQFGSALSRDWVVQAAGLPGLDARIGPDVAGGAALRTAADACRADPDLRPLGGLYARTTRLLWLQLHPTAPPTVAAPA